MTEKGSVLDKYYKHVDEVILNQLIDIDKRIDAIDNDTKLTEIITLVSEANSMVSFMAGDDVDEYDRCRYRLFVDNISGKVTIIQGCEVDVDFRGLTESDRLTEYDEDEVRPDEDDECDEDEDDFDDDLPDKDDPQIW